MDLAHLGDGNIVGENPYVPLSLLMDVEHDLGGLRGGFMEDRSEHFHYEIHGGVVIVVEDHYIHLRFFDLVFRLLEDFLLESAGGILGIRHFPSIVRIIFYNGKTPLRGLQFMIDRII
jgi:hypothetical protein